MTQVPHQEFIDIITGLTGLPCWNVYAGSVGSLISLHLGEKIPLTKPLPYPNPQLTPDEHKLRGEYILYIEDCPWRLDSPDEVVATWTDSNASDGPIVMGMKACIGAQVTHVNIIRPGLDLTLHFSNDLVLRVFPDQSDPEEGDNYSLSLADRTYIVAARSYLYVEDAEDA